MDNGDLTVGTVNRPQEGKDNRVVPAESDDARMVLAISRQGNERLSGESVVSERGEGGAVEELLVTILNLLDGELVVIRSHRYVPAINDLEPRKERVNL